MTTKWTRSHLSDVVDVSGRVKVASSGVTTNAEEGSVAISTILIEDPDGDLEIVGLHGFYGFETTAPTDLTCFYRGFIGERNVGRSKERGLLTGAARLYTLQAGDQNSLLSRRIFRPTDTDANRPAETDAERLTWLLGTAQMTHLDDETYVNLAGPKAMDASDYRHQTPADVLADLANASGKNYWVMFVESGGSGGGTFGLWYDFDSSEEYRTDLRISNYMSDQNADTYYPFIDAELTTKPDRVYSGLDAQYDGGAVFLERDATGDAFQYRDTVSYMANVKTSAKATAAGTRMLNLIATEEHRISCTIQVPRDEVNRLREGHGVECRFMHLPGFEEWTWMRVLNRTVTDVEDDDFYTIKVEMSADPPVVVARLLFAVVVKRIQTGMDETILPTVTVTADGASWNLLASSSFPEDDPSGGNMSGANISLWYTDLPTSPVDVLYATTNEVDGHLAAWVFEVTGIDESDLGSIVTADDNGLVARPSDLAFGGLTSPGDSVLFGAHVLQLLSYAYGNDVSGIDGTLDLVDLDRAGAPEVAYPGYQYVDPPWVWIGYKEVGAGSVGLDTSIDTTYVYSPVWNAWVAAAIPLAGSFSVLQSVHESSIILNEDIAVSIAP